MEINEKQHKFNFFTVILLLITISPLRLFLEYTVVKDGHLESLLINFGLFIFKLCALLALIYIFMRNQFNNSAVKYSKKFLKIQKRILSAKIVLPVIAFCILITVYGCWSYTKVPLVHIYHLPTHFTKRTDDFTANITGSLSKFVGEFQYRINNSAWQLVEHGLPRTPKPLFVIELDHDTMQNGLNTIEMQALAFGRKPTIIKRQFYYDSSEIKLPILEDWSKQNIQVDDGHWERVNIAGEWRIRPKPGYEGYDRILVVTGAFSRGRRIETNVIFRYQLQDTNNYGFGLLPLWGGHPDYPDFIPRRGWVCSIAWFYNHYTSVGNEFSYKIGLDDPVYVISYKSLKPRKNIKYNIVVECWPELDSGGQHIGYSQRMKWWQAGKTAPKTWIELSDRQGASLPQRKYGIGLLAYNCQVDFGKVAVFPLDGQKIQIN